MRQSSRTNYNFSSAMMYPQRQGTSAHTRFSNLKSANEALETLFIKSFGLHLIRLFPYTTADLIAGLSDHERDLLEKLEQSQSEG